MPRVETALSVLNNYVKSANYNRGIAFVAGKETGTLDIDAGQIATLAQELDSIVDWDASPRIAAMIVRGAPRILDAIRMVNSYTKQGYGGAAARGQSLVAQVMKADDLLKYDASTVALSTDAMAKWLRTYSAVGAAAWSGNSSYQNTMIVSSQPYLAHIILGFIDPVMVPKLNQIQLIKEGDAMVPEVLDWTRSTFGDNDTPTHELFQPWVIAPSQKYYIATKAYVVGDDKLQPVGFTIKRASDIISALV